MGLLNARVGGSFSSTTRRGVARSQGVANAFGFPLDGGVPSYAVQNIVDNFSSSATLSTIWTSSYGTYAISGGVASVQTSTGYSGLVSAPAWSLNNSYAYSKFTPAASGGSTSVSCEMAIVDSDVGDSSTNVEIYIDTASNQITFNSNVSWNDASRVTIAYDAVNHAWIRLRVDSGTLYWETSPDGTTWTVRRSTTAPVWLSKTNSYLAFWGHRADGSSSNLTVDNVNTLT